jgi:hypothetical protein
MENAMNTKALLLASLAGGLASTFLSNVPIINFVNCLLCAGFWAGPLLAVWLYKRQEGTVTMGQAIGIGTLAGVWAGLFGFTLSLVGLAGVQALAQSYSRFLPSDSSIDLGGAVTKIIFNVIGIGFNILFGLIGGLLGGAIFKPKAAPPAPNA